MRENKSGPDRWTTDQADVEKEALPKFGDGLPPSRSAFEELRKYPFFFADDADEPTTTPQARAAHAAVARSATVPPIPAPMTEIRPLLAQPPVVSPPPATAPRAEMPSQTLPPVRESAAPTVAASLAARHAAAIARKEPATLPSAAPLPVPIAPAIEEEMPAPATRVPQAPRAPQIPPQAQRASQPAQEPWYSRVPTGISLVAALVYFLIGGVALIGTGLVLGGLGGGSMALFGLVVTSVAAFVAWQELTNGRS